MAGREWVVARQDSDAVGRLVSSGFSGVLAKLLVNRGIIAPGEAGKFLADGDLQLSDAFLLKGMDAAAGRIRKALDSGEKIVVYGDYDVDGVTATALLLRFLLDKGANAGYYIPERESEGYGVNKEAVQKLAEAGATLVITVDTGISAFEEALFAKKLGIDMIVTDHHEPRGELPDVFALVNPRQPGCSYPYKELAGVGVAFKLVCALEKEKTPESLFRKYGGLVCLGTVADVVPLTGENRRIVRQGLKVLAECPGFGMKAMMDVSGLKPERLTSVMLSFTAAPRINAAGRMGSACDALRLLLSENEETAGQFARKLDESNKLRQNIENEIVAKVVAAIEDDPDLLGHPVLIVRGAGWHNGVIGIVASRLMEKFAKPVFVVSFDGEMGRASCRSIPGFNVHDALCACSDHLEKFGGHELAAGFSILDKNYDAFCESIDRYASSLGPLPGLKLNLDCELAPDEITLESALDCARLEPFGAGNPEPLFYIRAARICGITPLKEGRHLRMDLQKDGVRFKAMLFNAERTGITPERGDIVDLAASLAVNDYKGSRYLSVIVRDAVRSVVFEEQAVLYRKMLSDEAAVSGYVVTAPGRKEFAAVYRYLVKHRGQPVRLDRIYGAVSFALNGFRYFNLLMILDIFQEMKLITCKVQDEFYIFEIHDGVKVNLGDSALLRRLTGGPAQ